MREYRLRRKADPIKYQIYLERERIRNRNRKRYHKHNKRKYSSETQIDIEDKQLDVQIADACTEERRKVLQQNGVELSIVLKSGSGAGESIEKPSLPNQKEKVMPQKNRRKSKPQKLPNINYSLDDLFQDLEKIATKTKAPTRKSSGTNIRTATSDYWLEQSHPKAVNNNITPSIANNINNLFIQSVNSTAKCVAENATNSYRSKPTRKRVPVSDSVEIVPITIEQLIQPRRKQTAKNPFTSQEQSYVQNHIRQKSTNIKITSVSTLNTSSTANKLNDVELVDLTSDVSDDDDKPDVQITNKGKNKSTEMRKMSNKSKPNFFDSFLGFVTANTS